MLSILQIVLFFFIMNLSFAMQAYLPLRKFCLNFKTGYFTTGKDITMPEYKKVGYLTTDFKMFHLKDEEMRTFHYHYHDFHKILILLNGDVTYCIEGRSYDLKKNDIVLVLSLIHISEPTRPY